MRPILLLGLLCAGIGFSQNYSVRLQPATSLLTALAAAGGLEQVADRSRVIIQRGTQEIVIDLRAILVGKKSDVPLEDGDRIFLGAK